MTRKHFKAIAEAIAQTRRDYYLNSVQGPSSDAINAALASLEDKLCVAFRQENPLFSREKFHQACRAQ